MSGPVQRETPGHDTSRLLHHSFTKQVRRVPDRTALIESERSVSFAELDARSTTAASALQESGMRPGALVGLHLERSVEWVVGVLGILKAGGTVVPLPPSYPLERRREILEYASLDAVVENDHWPVEPSLDARVLNLGKLERCAAPDAAEVPVSPDQPAFILCSSGSTGRPKMIARSHRSFFHRLEWTWGRHPFTDADVGCHKAPTTTTHGVYELFEPLLAGAPAVIVTDEESRNLERFWETIGERRVTRLLIVPSALQASLDMPGFLPPALGVLVLMGEPVQRSLAERVLRRFPDRTALYSIYGSTEASSALVCNLRDPLRPGAELPLGTPIAPEVVARVLGPELREVTPGQAGRLYVGGPLLFSGYHRDPALTARVMVTIPDTGEAMYDTHDDVRVAAGGDIEYVGRADDTVKVRGFRVDLQEVERCLQEHPQVRQAAAVVDMTQPANPTLLAFVVPSLADTGSLFRHVRERLPSYMVPSAIIGREAFPLTVRGKLDRRRLLDERAPPAQSSAHEAPGTEAERQVAAAWTAVLGHDRFGRYASFFEAGGTSLTAFALVHRLREAFGLGRGELDGQSVYRHPTLAAMAAHVERLRRGDRQPAEPAISALVTLRSARRDGLAPLFVVSSAGGTLGAYDRLVKHLETPREIIGIRDAYLWGGRDPDSGFTAWVDLYLDAIRSRQPNGPYFLCAYSSAGAFGYELARRLEAAGQPVEVLILIDPLGLDLSDKSRFGWWAMRATYARPWVRAAVRLAGRARRLLPRHLLSRTSGLAGPGMSRRAPVRPGEPGRATADPAHLASLSALMELDTGLPLALEAADLTAMAPGDRLGALQERLARHLPDVEADMIERIVSQYPSQVREQNAYAVQSYGGHVLLLEPRTRHAGLLRLLLSPYADALDAAILDLGMPDARTGEITGRFGALAGHYRCMRDSTFVQQAARRIDQTLESAASERRKVSAASP